MSQVEETKNNVSVPHEKGIHVVQAVTIDRPVGELYNFWQNPTHLPEVFKYVKSVEPLVDNRAHWVLKLPGGLKTEFDAEVYTDIPNEVISWRSLPGSSLQNAGSVRFRSVVGEGGTEVQLTIEVVPPGGALGRAVLQLFGEAPAQYVGQFLQEFKQVIETGAKPQ